MKGPGIEKQNPSRRARRLPPSRRFEPQGLGVVPNGICLLKVRSFPAHAPNAVPTRFGEQTHSEGQCRWWSAVYYTGAPKAESPLSQGPRPAFVKVFYTHVYVSAPTTPNSLRLTSTKENTIPVSPSFTCCVLMRSNSQTVSQQSISPRVHSDRYGKIYGLSRRGLSFCCFHRH